MNEAPFAVVVSSCDAYADLWPYFFHFLFRYWPDVPQPVYLISCRKRYDDPRVRSMQLGEDLQWSTNLLKTLDQIPQRRILYFQDDYLLNAPVDPAGITKLVEFFDAHQAAYLCVDRQEYVSTPTDLPGVVVPTLENAWVVGLQAALWSQDALRGMIQPGWTPWHAEEALNLEAKARGGKGFYAVEKNTELGVPYVQTVRGRLWLKEGLDHCAKHGLKPDLRLRGRAPFRAGWWNRHYRSYQKWRNTRWRRRLGFDHLEKIDPV